MHYDIVEWDKPVAVNSTVNFMQTQRACWICEDSHVFLHLKKVYFYFEIYFSHLCHIIFANFYQIIFNKNQFILFFCLQLEVQQVMHQILLKMCKH